MSNPIEDIINDSIDKKISIDIQFRNLVKVLTGLPIDQRKLSIAATNIEQGLMWLTSALEDEDNE